MTFMRLTTTGARSLVARLRAAEAALPNVYLFGSGHVGKALAKALAPLPVHVHVIDTRPDELADLPPGVEARAVPMPEAVVREAPAGSAYAILTHDHALDFLIAAEALRRIDAAYVGMIGSETKARSLFAELEREGVPKEKLARVRSPIGLPLGRTQEPAAVAVSILAEVLKTLNENREAPGATPED